MRWSRFIMAALIGLGGTALVFQALDWMNRASAPQEKALARAAVDFSVAPLKRKKTLQRRVLQRQPQRRPMSRPRAPLPSLATALSGVNFGIPPISADSLAGAHNSLLGADAALEDVVMTANAVDAPPRPAEQVPPRYPARARAEGVTGQVKLRMLVGQDGRVVEAKVVEAAPRGVFEEAALSAIRQWRYTPATYRGQPVKMWAEMVMRFNLG